jgi:hypothetical protein
MPGKHGGNQGGRPKVVINYKTLKGLCQILCTGEECAAILDMDYDALNNGLKAANHGGFTDYLKKHGADGKASLRRRQFKTALEDGNVTMQIWLGKQHLDQTDKRETNVNVKTYETFDDDELLREKARIDQEYEQSLRH